MTWQSAAVGIPVWEGCGVAYIADSAFFVGHALTADTWAVDVREGGFYRSTGRKGVPEWTAYGDGWVVALPDPDTQAAYLRRLAIALGAEPHHAACGVTIGWIRGVLMVWAGIPDTGPEPGDIVWPFERSVAVPKDVDKTTALALAWPADKRVGA